jgi:hypothetical protein
MSDKKSGCTKGIMGCGGVGCALVIAAVAAGFAFSPQIKDLVNRGLVKAKEAVEDHPVYREALARAEADPRVTEKLGTPIDRGGPFAISSIQVQREGGTVTLEMETGIEGPDGEGRLEIRGFEREGEVTFEKLVFWTDGEGIDLLT